jgi:hypothetical protein
MNVAFKRWVKEINIGKICIFLGITIYNAKIYGKNWYKNKYNTCMHSVMEQIMHFFIHRKHIFSTHRKHMVSTHRKHIFSIKKMLIIFFSILRHMQQSFDEKICMVYRIHKMYRVRSLCLKCLFVLFL